jgi:hypothetical protein
MSQKIRNMISNIFQSQEKGLYRIDLVSLFRRFQMLVQKFDPHN